MLKVLVNSYTCCPGMGSEQGMGWNWITSLAKTGEVELFVISEGEYRPQIENYLRSEKIKVKSRKFELDNSDSWTERIHFYWNPVPPEVRKMCWNQGDWRFYKYYREWQQRTAMIARNIIVQERRKDTGGINILHQLNMIGFREPGFLWKVSREAVIPFVWGPIGGLKQFPMAYANGGGFRMKVFARLKNVVNKWQIKHDKRVNEAFKQSSVLISSIPDSYNAIKKYQGLESIIIPETGCDLSPVLPNIEDELKRFYNKLLTILWVGKFDFRKRLDIALKTIALLKDKDIVMRVYGTGNEQQITDAHEFVRTLGIQDKVQFMGACPNEEVTLAMRNADLFFFTSVSEDTSTVVLEAVSHRLPVLCFDCCGMAAVIDDRIGCKVPLTNPKLSVKDFAATISDFYIKRYKLAAMSDNCAKRAIELSWDNKAKKMIDLYKKAKLK